MHKNLCLKNLFANAENDDGLGVRYPTAVKLAGFRFQLNASNMSSYTEELHYKETVRLWMTIYIYIYI